MLAEQKPCGNYEHGYIRLYFICSQFPRTARTLTIQFMWDIQVKEKQITSLFMKVSQNIIQLHVTVYTIFASWFHPLTYTIT